MGGWLNGWVGQWMGGWVSGWMDGWTALCAFHPLTITALIIRHHQVMPYVAKAGLRAALGVSIGMRYI